MDKSQKFYVDIETGMQQDYLLLSLGVPTSTNLEEKNPKTIITTATTPPPPTYSSPLHPEDLDLICPILILQITLHCMIFRLVCCHRQKSHIVKGSFDHELRSVALESIMKLTKVLAVSEMF